MPDQNNTNQTQDQPATTTAPPVPPVMDQPPAPPPPPVPDFQSAMTDVPPMPESAVPPSETTVPENMGSAAPTDLSNITTAAPKKKFGGKKVIATILGVLLLVGGIGAGYLLTQQPQIFRGEAWQPQGVDGGPYKGDTQYSDFPSGDDEKDKDIVIKDPYIPPPTGNQLPSTTISYDLNNSSCGRDLDPNAPACCSASVKSSCGGGGSQIVCEPGNRQECKVGNDHCTIDADSADCGGANQAITDEGGGPTPTPGQSASCQNIKAYSETWVLLTTAQLSALKANDKVNFCVLGVASSGTFDMARFTINGSLKANTTTVRPGTTDFCQNYTIPAATTAFNVSAQIHHATLGWK